VRWLAVSSFWLVANSMAIAVSAQDAEPAQSEVELAVDAEPATPADVVSASAETPITSLPDEAESEGPPPGVEVMRVKGRAISGIETDAPESVTQFDAESIAALGAGNIADLAKVTPNVEIRSAGATTATFFIRGVGLSDFSSNAAGAVAIYRDEVPLNSPAIQNGQLFDTLTVNVKRGPQGSGLFRNASAGAIMIYANKPSGEYEARLRSSMGSFWSNDARDAFISDTQGMINLPLIEETLSTRIAFRVRSTDPFLTNGCGNDLEFEDRGALQIGFPGREKDDINLCGEQKINSFEVSPVPAGLPTQVGDRGDWEARGSLRFSPPNADMDWLLSIHGGRLDQDSTLGQAIGVGKDPVGDVIFGFNTASGYFEPDQKKEFDEHAWENLGVSNQEEFNSYNVPGLSNMEVAAIKAKANKDARSTVNKKLTKRSLDRKPFRGDYNKVGQTTRDTYGGYLRGDFPLGENLDVTTITGYEYYERFRDSDNDFTPEVQFELLVTDHAKQFSQDITIAGHLFDEAVRWSFGASYLEETLYNRAYTDVDPPGLDFPDPIRRTYSQDTSAFMVTAQLSWEFMEDFTLEVGARFNQEDKSFEMEERVFAAEPSIFVDQSDSWSEPTGGISLSYHINDATSVFAKYTHGYKVGHFNSNSVKDIFQSGPANPEFIDSFEWGLIGSWVENRIRARGAFFFYKYDDYQVFVFSESGLPGEAPSLVIRNAQAVQQYGAEVDLTVNPLKGWVPESIEGLDLTVRFGWLESEFLEFTNTVFRTGEGVNSLGVFPVALNYGGNRLINSPEFKVSGTVLWPFDLGEWGTITPRYDVVWSDDIFFDPTEGRGVAINTNTGDPFLPKHALGQRAFWLHNIRLSYRTPIENIEISGWVRNLLDERYKTFAFDASGFANEVINFVGDPRSAGVDVSITW
jgi:outer membrane receptor protein involved in Fe transport